MPSLLFRKSVKKEMRLPRDTFFTNVSFNSEHYSYSGLTAASSSDYMITVGPFKVNQTPPLRTTGTLRGTSNSNEYAGVYRVISLLKDGYINFKIA